MTKWIPGPDELPASLPVLRDHAGRRFCRWLLRRAGWHFVGEMPTAPRLVAIVAPHSSWWDGIWGILMKTGLGLKIHFMAKKEVFRGPLGWLLRHLDGIRIDRSSSKGVVEQMVDTFAASDKMWLGITPEGTRTHVPEWKTGFWRIASEAGVPVFPVAFHYPDKAVQLGPLLQPGENMEADIAELRAFYAPFQGKYHGL